MIQTSTIFVYSKKTEKFRALQHNYNIVSTSRPSYFIISSKFLQFHSNCPGVFVVILSMRLVLLIESNRTDFQTAKQPVLCTMSNYIETGFLHLKFFFEEACSQGIYKNKSRIFIRYHIIVWKNNLLNWNKISERDISV